MRADFGRVAILQRRLGGCVFWGGLFSGGGVAPFVIPAGLIAADSLRRLAGLLDVPVARRLMEWASIACGGVVACGLLMFSSSSRDAAGFLSFMTLSLAISLYALGLAAWTAPAGTGAPSGRLCVSVVLWWSCLALLGIHDHIDRPGQGATMVAAVVAGFAAAGLLLYCHQLVAGAMEQVAAEDEEPTPVSP